MLPDRVSNPGPLTYESGALPIALRGPAKSELERKNRTAHIYGISNANFENSIASHFYYLLCKTEICYIRYLIQDMSYLLYCIRYLN